MGLSAQTTCSQSGFRLQPGLVEGVRQVLSDDDDEDEVCCEDAAPVGNRGLSVSGACDAEERIRQKSSISRMETRSKRSW
jgi:hypothetical protein